MDIEPLPKVTFLPAQLTELVIKNWTGDIIDYEKNGQICKVYHGQGTCQFRDGHTYKGELKHGLLHGKGTFNWTDGTVYKGEFNSNEITGVGRYQWPDKSTFEGKVKNGLRHGVGKYINVKEGVEYQGEWLDGMRHGSGTLTYKNGSIYEGQWERGMKWGNGKMTYASGNYYEGQWASNKRNGQGTMFWLTSDEKYEGNWEDNFQSGFGAHIWLDGSTDNKLLRNRYVGYWKLGQRYGKGTFYYSNGSKYEGEWKENFKHGRGVFTFEDGTQYIGPFENDRMIDREVPQKDLGHSTTYTEKDDKKDAQKSAKKPANAKKQGDTISTKDGKSVKSGAADKMGATTTSSKFNQAKSKQKEVEENPFKKLIDISDLMELEANSEDTLKEIQKILLMHNSELKNWYRTYSRKIEAHKSDESFAMTLRQVWRFLRDTQLISANSTVAQFNRVYNMGNKNHFTLLGSQDQSKFDKIYGDKSNNDINVMESNKNDISDDENETELTEANDPDAEDTHDSLKIVLQRQFFEVVVRAAAVKYACGGDGAEQLPTLAMKLDHLFQHNYKPMAIKNKCKSQEEEKAFKVADKVFDEYQDKLSQVFHHFSKKSENVKNGRKDTTLEIDELIDMLKKANLLEGKTELKLQDVIFMLERYYAPQNSLQSKLDQEKFDAYIEANPMLLKVNQEAAAKEQAKKEAAQKKLEAAEGEEGEQQEEPEEAEMTPEEEEALTARKESELTEIRESWTQNILSEHLVYIKGVEIVYFEFKEILLELAMKMKDQVDAAPGKLKSLVKKFLDEMFLKRLTPYIKFNKAQTDTSTAAATIAQRSWPQSEKDAAIKAVMDERKKKQEEEERVKAELAAQKAEEEAEALAAAAHAPEADQEVKPEQEEVKPESKQDEDEEEDEDEEPDGTINSESDY